MMPISSCYFLCVSSLSRQLLTFEYLTMHEVSRFSKGESLSSQEC